MLTKYNKVISGSCYKKILIDITFNSKHEASKVIIFSHGFKGFKDWGPFNKIAEYFANNGFVFVKFNFSHNGTSIDNPLEFVDLSSFGNNNFCKELDDLGLVMNWAIDEFSVSKVNLFGHSRGGAISILKSAEDNRILNVISWASPSDFFAKLPIYEKAQKWKETNVAYIYNGRTKQNMPLYYQFYQNCMSNKDRLNIKNAVVDMKVPHLHIHGDADPTVLIEEAYNLKSWNSKVNLHIIKEANHVFDGCHPYGLVSFPKHLKNAVDASINFLKN